MKSLAEIQHYGTNATNSLLDQNYLYKQDKSIYSTNNTSNYLIDETKSSMFIPTVYNTSLTSSASVTLPTTLQSIDNDLCKSYMSVTSDQFCSNSIVTTHLNKKMKKIKNSSKKNYYKNFKIIY